MQDELPILRTKIDELDKALIDLLSKRRGAIARIGEIKKAENAVPLDQKRWQEIVDTRLAWAKEAGLEEVFIRNLLEEIHGWSLEIQKK